MRRNLQGKRDVTSDDRSIDFSRSLSGSHNGDWLASQNSGRQRSADSSRPIAVPKLKLNLQSASTSMNSSASFSAELAPLVPPITPREDSEDARDTFSSGADRRSFPFNPLAVDWFDDFDFSSFRSSEAYILSADTHDADATEEGSLRDIVSMDSMSSFIGDDSSDASPRGSSDPLADDSYEFSPETDVDSASPFLHRFALPLRFSHVSM
jgi:hypothetical protein